MTPNELYHILTASAALQENAYVQWTTNSLHLYLHHEYDNIKTNPIPTGDYIYIQHKIHLQYFHNLVFKTIISWSTTNDEHQDYFICLRWKIAINKGLQAMSTWEDIQSLLGITTIL
jgi:hypothetical protein